VLVKNIMPFVNNIKTSVLNLFNSENLMNIYFEELFELKYERGDLSDLFGEWLKTLLLDKIDTIILAQNKYIVYIVI